MNLDPVGRDPETLLTGAWCAFGRTAAAAHRAGARVVIVQAAWEDAEREIEGVPCHFVREHGDPLIRLPGGRRWLFRWGFAPLAGVAFTARKQAEPFRSAGILGPSLRIFEVIEISSS